VVTIVGRRQYQDQGSGQAAEVAMVDFDPDFAKTCARYVLSGGEISYGLRISPMSHGAAGSGGRDR